MLFTVIDSLGELDRDRPGKHPQPSLAGAVGRVAGHRQVLVNRGDVEDAPPSSLKDHLAGGGLADEKRTDEVDGEDLLKLVDRIVDELGLFLDARVVDDDVHPAECLDRRRDQAGDLVRARDVRADGGRFPAEFPYLLLDRHRRIRGPDVVDHDRGALLCKANRNRPPYPGCGPRHDGHLVLQAHGSSWFDVRRTDRVKRRCGPTIDHPPLGGCPCWLAQKSVAKPSLR